MAAEGETIVDQAVDWRLRQDSLSGDEWRDFLAWMEADAAHADAFNALMMDDALLGMRDAAPDEAFARQSVMQAGQEGAVRRRPMLWGGIAASGLAAACALAVVNPFASADPDYYTVQTRPGGKRQVVLDDGTRIDLSGGTIMRFDHNDARFAQLVEGEATFAVTHDAANPFAVQVAGVQLRDLGTVFNVRHDGKRLDVQVGEGAVMFESGDDRVKLDAGKGLSYFRGAGVAQTMRVDPAQVGEWREGRLHFSGTALDTVAQSLGRHVGVMLRVDPSIAQTPFTGTISISNDGQADIRHFARLAGVQLNRNRQGWSLTAAEHDPAP